MPATTLAVLGPLWIIGAQVLHSTLYVGLRWTAAYGELDREWLARLNGEKLIPMLTWSVLAAVTLMLPMLVFEQWPTTYAAIVGAASGPIGAWLGRSAQSFGAGSSADKTGAAWWTGMMREAAITIATLLFAATLFMLLGRLGAIIVERLAALLADVSWLDRTWLIALRCDHRCWCCCRSIAARGSTSTGSRCTASIATGWRAPSSAPRGRPMNASPTPTRASIRATICACRTCIRARNSAAFCSRW